MVALIEGLSWVIIGQGAYISALGFDLSMPIVVLLLVIGFASSGALKSGLPMGSELGTILVRLSCLALALLVPSRHDSESATKPSAVSLTVTSKGQVILRKELLAHLGIQPGQGVDVEVRLIG